PPSTERRTRETVRHETRGRRRRQVQGLAHRRRGRRARRRRAAARAPRAAGARGPDGRWRGGHGRRGARGRRSRAPRRRHRPAGRARDGAVRVPRRCRPRADGGARDGAGLRARPHPGGRRCGDAGAPLPGGGDALRRLARVDLSGLDPRLADTELVLAADVENPLLGPDGAAAVYGPQKGADEAAVADLEAGLARWVEALVEAGAATAREIAAARGAGAAGGVGFGALLLGATRRRGVDVVLDLTGFDDAVAGAALVVTGEGSLDEQ